MALCHATPSRLEICEATSVSEILFWFLTLKVITLVIILNKFFDSYCEWILETLCENLGTSFEKIYKEFKNIFSENFCRNFRETFMKFWENVCNKQGVRF